jgi:ABC-type transport system substrate-binding protein
MQAMKNFSLLALVVFAYSSSANGDLQKGRKPAPTDIRDVKISSIESPVQREKRNMFVVGTFSMPETMDPLTNRTWMQFLAVQSTFQTLVRNDESGSIVGDLARRWDVLDNGRSFRFTLREGVKFHSGSVVTAHDVAYSLARHVWPNSKSVIKGYIQDNVIGAENVPEGKLPMGIQPVSTNQVTITLQKAYPTFLSLLALPGFSIVEISKVAQSTIVGSGPMIPTFDPATKSWRFLKNPSYLGSGSLAEELLLVSLPSVSRTIELLKSNEVDLVIGFPMAELDTISMPTSYIATPSNSLAYLHFFFNSERREELGQQSTRKTIGILIQHALHDVKFQNLFFENQKTFLPRGVMPAKYYKQSECLAEQAVLPASTQSSLRQRPLQIVVGSHFLPKQAVERLQETLKRNGIGADVIWVDRKEHVRRNEAKDFDIITGSYMGNIPDPDGFLEPLNPSNPGRHGFFDSRLFFQKICGVRFHDEAAVRLAKYSDVMEEFESLWYVVPLYRVRLPLIHRREVQLPDTTFKYEVELHRLAWGRRK